MKHLFASLDNILKVSFTTSSHTDYQKKKKKKMSLRDLESILSKFYQKLFCTFAETSNYHPKQ